MRVRNPERKCTASNQALKTIVADPEINNPDHISESLAVLRIRDVYPGSEFFSILDPGSTSKNLSIFAQEIVLVREPDFLPIPDPGIKKAPDPGSGSATLELRTNFLWDKILKFFDAILDPGWKKFESVIKIRIRDKHPGSATLSKKTVEFQYQYLVRVVTACQTSTSPPG
jgi:hypothetical protein